MHTSKIAAILSYTPVDQVSLLHLLTPSAPRSICDVCKIETSVAKEEEEKAAATMQQSQPSE